MKTTKFAKLPVVESLRERVSNSIENAGRIALIGIQHLLPTTGSLIEAIIEAGIKPEDIFLMGKPYSAAKSVQQQLSDLGVNTWALDELGPRRFGYHEAYSTMVDQFLSYFDSCRESRCYNKILVLDDGGYCHSRLPPLITNGSRIVGIEQTTSGLRDETRQDHFPSIQVATSALKTHVEPEIIAHGLKNRLRQKEGYDFFGNLGIVGYGSIGKGIARVFTRDSNEIRTFDRFIGSESADPVIRCHSLRDLISVSDFVFGCTGSDISASNEWLSFLPFKQVLVSVSSGIVEFENLIQLLFQEPVARSVDHFKTISWSSSPGDRNLTIVNGGYPANFSDGIEWETTEDIQLTRGLLFGAIAQAAEMLVSETPVPEGEYRLSAEIQKLVSEVWLGCGSELAEKWQREQRLVEREWLEMHSSGKPSPAL